MDNKFPQRFRLRMITTNAGDRYGTLFYSNISLRNRGIFNQLFPGNETVRVGEIHVEDEILFLSFRHFSRLKNVTDSFR